MTRNYDIKKKAKKRVKKKKEFFEHLISFISTMVFLLIINLLTSPGYLWVVWPLLGWGVGLAIHYFTVFGFFGLGTEDWEEREFEREMWKIKSKELPEDQDDDYLELDSNDSLELKQQERMYRKKWDDRDLV